MEGTMSYLLATFDLTKPLCKNHIMSTLQERKKKLKQFTAETKADSCSEYSQLDITPKCF